VFSTLSCVLRSATSQDRGGRRQLNKQTGRQTNKKSSKKSIILSRCIPHTSSPYWVCNGGGRSIDRLMAGLLRKRSAKKGKGGRVLCLPPTHPFLKCENAWTDYVAWIKKGKKKRGNLAQNQLSAFLRLLPDPALLSVPSHNCGSDLIILFCLLSTLFKNNQQPLCGCEGRDPPFSLNSI